MSDDTCPAGKRAICVVATQSSQLVCVDKRGEPYDSFRCYLKPLLVQGSDGV